MICNLRWAKIIENSQRTHEGFFSPPVGFHRKNNNSGKTILYKDIYYL